MSSVESEDAPGHLAPNFENSTGDTTADYKTIRFRYETEEEYWVAIQLQGGETDFFLQVWVMWGYGALRGGQAWRIELPNGRVRPQAYAQLVYEILKEKQRRLDLGGFIDVLTEMEQWARHSRNGRNWSKFLKRYRA
jgi:hypothetical protein